MKPTIKLLSIPFGLIFACAVAMAVLPDSTVFFSFKWLPDQTQMAGLSTNEYSTNITVTIVSTVNVATPTNQWPVVAAFPMSVFMTQGPPGTIWTNQLAMDGLSRFYAIVMTNGNGGSSPFSNLAPGLTAPVAGVLLPLKVQ